jgi:hypothetical protein
MCVASFAQRVHTTIQGVGVYEQRECERASTDHVGTLKLCTTHARMARDGWVSEWGGVCHPLDRADLRRAGVRWHHAMVLK